MKSLNESLKQATAVLQAANLTEARRDALLLLGCATKHSKTYLLTHGDELLNAEQARRFAAYIERRARHEPVQYITGEQDFYNLTFEVTREVLIPRPETELIVEAVCELTVQNQAARVLEIGVGSGCIIISILHQRLAAQGLAVDVSASALAVAARNARRHGVETRLRLIESDGFANVNNEATDHQTFDFIVSNPPYIAGGEVESLSKEVKDYEPRIALTPDATPDGDGLRIIKTLINESHSYLADNGFLIFEIGYNQRAQVEALIEASRWRVREVKKDLRGIERVCVLQK